jgi:hypothetical protein
VRGRRAKQLLLPLAATAAALTAGELGLRIATHERAPGLAALRSPELYGDYFSDDVYWLLYQRFGGRYRAPPDPHPLLGWVGAFDRTSLVHHDAHELRGRRPVLLYGDSFAACVASPCFQEVLNDDPEFSRRCYLLNYGVGGYGLDQIYLLMRETLGLYADPIVVFGALTEDVDRTVLKVRVGQKPYFELEDGELVLRGVPITAASQAALEREGPRVWSYLWRLLVHSRQVQGPLRDALRREASLRRNKEALADAILRRAVADLRGHEAHFLLFVGDWRGVSSIVENDDWRLQALIEPLAAAGAAVLNTKERLRADLRASGRSVGDYFLPDGHYTGETNRLVAGWLKQELTSCAGS